MIPTFSETAPAYAKLLEQKYRDAELKKLIAENKGESELNLSSKKLTSQDLEIVACYVVQENKVSDVVFYVII